MSAAIIIALAVAGIVLLAVEIFVIPGFGVSGILGIVALMAAIFLGSDSPGEAVLYTAVALAAIGGMVFIGFKNGFLAKRLFLTDRQSKKEGYLAPKPDFSAYVGRSGVALSPLRPAGTADFDGERLDVVTEGSFIRKGAAIKILAVEGARIIVREIDSL